MCRLNKKLDPNVETGSLPEGNPLFMFQPIESLDDPVNLFTDDHWGLDDPINLFTHDHWGLTHLFMPCS
jgi:hypothetical protein